MSATYQKPYVIPEGFPALLKAFTREILRAQPDSIYDFGAEYFQTMLNDPSAMAPSGSGEAHLQEEDHVSGAGGAEEKEKKVSLNNIKDIVASLEVSTMSMSEIETLAMQLFIEADADGSGALDRKEFAAVLTSAELSLSQSQIRQILAEADEDEDGVINYKEFLPVMLELLQFIKSREHVSTMFSRIEDMVREEVEDFLLRGLSKAALDDLLLAEFKKADKDGSGELSRSEFRACLRATKLGLTRKDINFILSQVDSNKDSQISYVEFVPVGFKLLVDRFKDEYLVSDIMTNLEGLQGQLLTAFTEKDSANTGVLSLKALKEVLSILSYETLGLSHLQRIALVSQAPTTKDGLVQYVHFVPQAAAIIMSMYSIDNMKLRIETMKQCSEGGGMKSLGKLDTDALCKLLRSQFSAADEAGQGLLAVQQVMDILENLGALAPDTVPITETHQQAMFAAIDVNIDGYVDWEELVTFACDVIEFLEREAYIMANAPSPEDA